MASSDSTSTIKTLMCYCGKKACLRTSWTNNNLRRGFHGCGDVASGCGFFVWEDPPMCTRSKKIIPGLLRKLNKIEEEFSEMKNKVNLLHKMEEEVAEMKRKLISCFGANGTGGLKTKLGTVGEGAGIGTGLDDLVAGLGGLKTGVDDFVASLDVVAFCSPLTVAFNLLDLLNYEM
ncbi:hypothetical protein Sango_1724200 [Sesamum angolense]|uniref:GRF-type domain-containing protein n=1 Tax=Sesamum angolense TaxID=2727404 RepID=A0AAE1WM21_9LAMI|nr:hypothetical protein Sango_1724200 [Sesamum angolense]